MSDVGLYTDAAILMASLLAALYCLRVQRSLKRLQRMDKGLGQAIESMSQATRRTETALKTLREEIAQSVGELDHRYAELKNRRQELDDLLDTVDGQFGHQVKRCREARQLTEQALTPLLRKAETEIMTLTRALELKARFDNLDQPPPPPQPEDDIDSLLAPLRPSVKRQTPETSPNPFLRAVNG